MHLLLFIFSISSKVLLNVQKDKETQIDYLLTDDHSDLTVSLTNLNPKNEIRFDMKKDSRLLGHDINSLSILDKEFRKTYTDKGLYTLVIYNLGDEDSLVSLQSTYNKVLGNEDKDVKALKTLFNEIEGRLSRLYDLYLRLKTIQENNIREAQRIIRGLYVMLIIPVVYILVGLAKIKAVKMMFAPKKGIKP
ncbi:transmembrane EMP24 domain-containing protein [Vairimorpha necatrix]|uniref:Transmembrane EMP24 domain-containing protein n=1 Tax=Vairimorpha necatrix TaxID=6039 RepID=A0AAX4JBJ8_9MICR